MRDVIRTVIAAALACFPLAATAADLPYQVPAAPANTPGWTGFYLGAYGAGAFGQTQAMETGLPTSGVACAGGGGACVSGNYSLDHNIGGWLAGAEVGYNWQAGRLVVGAEADFGAGNVHGDGTLSGTTVAQQDGNFALPGNFVTASEKIDYFSTLRARVGGLVADDILVYGTGGVAYGRVNTNGQFHYATGRDYIASDTAWRLGWTAGGGVEYILGPLWTLKAEYLYFDLGKQTIVSNFAIPGQPFQSQFDFNTHGSIARAGLNYAFPSEPVAARY